MTERERIDSQISYVLKCKHDKKRRQVVFDLVVGILVKRDEDLQWLAREMYLHLIKKVEQEIADFKNLKTRG